MRLEIILDNLNSLEKNSFIKIIDNLINSLPKSNREVDKIIAKNEGDLKSADSINISKIFQLLEPQYTEHLIKEIQNSNLEFKIIQEILIRDGNCIMTRDWLKNLIELEFKNFARRVKEFKKVVADESTDIDQARFRDYKIYQKCVDNAFNNDLEFGQEPKITKEERTILVTLSEQLELSREESLLIEAPIVGYGVPDVDSVIKDLKDSGIILFGKKNNQIYVPDEIVRLLRTIKGKSVADKYFRRVLRHLMTSQINMLLKKHRITKKQSNLDNIDSIIKEGVGFKNALLSGIHKQGSSKSEIKNVINKLLDKDLKLDKKLPGNTAEIKVDNLIKYFEDIDKETKVNISLEGYDKLVADLTQVVPKTKQKIKSEFQLQGKEDLFTSNYLLDFNIKPRDILYLLDDSELNKFCAKQKVSTRGDLVHNILRAFKDASNLYVEHYNLIASRDWKGLKENGINLKESEIGVKFEGVTKTIFKKLGFNVDESLRKKINTSKDKIDIVLNLDHNNLILVECKSSKGGNFGKYSSVSRQIKAYSDLAKRNGYNVLNCLLVAPEFTDEFIKDCRYEAVLNLSLISSNSLKNILKGFKQSSFDKLPHTLLTKDVVIEEERIIKALQR